MESKTRNLHKEAIYAAIEKYTITKDKFDVVDELSKAGVPCGPVLTWAEIEKDKSLYECGTLVKVEQPERGEFLTIGCPQKFSNFTPDITSAPLLGADTDSILKELGYTDEQIKAFHTNHIVCK